ncbi:hypothetical protein TNCV_2862941 [Trichonephila clavipes]|nr:hypothetical protein TNCV_2862941 [Trichonephila clavipes]
MLAANFNVDHSTIDCLLKKLGKVRKLAGGVPHELRDNDKSESVRIFASLLLRNERSPFLKDLFTGYESWSLQKPQKKEGLRFSRSFSKRNNDGRALNRLLNNYEITFNSK